MEVTERLKSFSKRYSIALSQIVYLIKVAWIKLWTKFSFSLILVFNRAFMEHVQIAKLEYSERKCSAC